MSALSAFAEAQLDLVQLLVSMYLPTELTLSEHTQALYDRYLEDPATVQVEQVEELEAELSLPLDEYDQGQSELVVFQITLSLTMAESEEKVKIRVKQPIWLNRTSYETLLSSIQPLAPDGDGESSEYLLNTFDTVRSSMHELYIAHKAKEEEAQLRLKMNGGGTKNEIDEKLWEGQIDRVWFWFPTLSTKEKRADLVNFANEWSLTGFVLAGKPALLCVEGPGQLVEKYMSRIKSESWSDIPSHHKKVTERFRRPLENASSRSFTSMKEITHLIPKYGQYNHRGDMSEVKRLMEEWGVGDDFGAVVMNSGS